MGAGEMSQKLRAQAVFPEDPCWVPTSHMVTRRSLQVQSQGNPTTSAGPVGTAYTWSAEIQAGKTLIHIKNIS